MLYGSEIDSFLWRDRHPVVLILSLEKAVRVSDATRERRQE
jgi:hypothetical protein